MSGIEPKDPWASRWEENQTGWDLQGPHPSNPRLLELLRGEAGIKEGRVLVPGCGRAHDVVYFANHGFSGKGIDFVEAAIDAAKKLYDNVPGVELAVEDAFAETEEGSFDLIYDRAMLCALQPENRDKYVQAMAKKLRQGGFFSGIIFSAIDYPSGMEGPPFALNEPELASLLAQDFNLVSWENHPAPKDIPIIKSEWILIWQKK